VIRELAAGGTDDHRPTRDVIRSRHGGTASCFLDAGKRSWNRARRPRSSARTRERTQPVFLQHHRGEAAVTRRLPYSWYRTRSYAAERSLTSRRAGQYAGPRGRRWSSPASFLATGPGGIPIVVTRMTAESSAHSRTVRHAGAVLAGLRRAQARPVPYTRGRTTWTVAAHRTAPPSASRARQSELSLVRRAPTPGGRSCS